MMKVTRFLAALGLSCGLASAAMAQSTGTMAAPGGTMAPPSGTMAPMAPMANMAPAAKPVTGKLPKTDEFSTVAAASAHCPNDTVVWSTLSRSKSFHLSGSRYYGKTKHGAYVCKSEALSYGFHPSKT